MKIDNNFITFLKSEEGVRYHAYPDSKGIPTIGIGFIEVNGKPVKLGDTITDAEIENQLRIQLVKYEAAVNSLIKVPITQNMYDAIVSFTFNEGIGALERSTLLKVINNNPHDPQIKQELLKYNEAGGKIIAGLSARRIAEGRLYFTP